MEYIYTHFHTHPIKTECGHKQAESEEINFRWIRPTSLCKMLFCDVRESIILLKHILSKFYLGVEVHLFYLRNKKKEQKINFNL